MRYGNQSPVDNLIAFFKQKSLLSKLILINIIVFAAINIINLLLFLFNVGDGQNTVISEVTRWLAVPAQFSQLIQKPWTLFSYMFLQEGFFHLLFNMIILYFGGKIFSEYLDDQKLLKTYLFGGFFGALFFIISYNIFPVFQDNIANTLALGSSASVLAILIAIATYVPEYSVNLIFIGRTKLKYIAVIFIVLDIFNIQTGNEGGHLAHLGGALWGFIYSRSLLKGNDLVGSLNFGWMRNFFVKKKKSPFTNIHRNKRPLSDEEYNARKVSKQKDIDKILDKISKSGYNSLTEKEKEILFKHSNNDK
ncbi:MAG: rhomboid family intramembrane serine protease [Bacteroidota bacterium]|nr:rhomboid family intramembrane serine protease [Bacteroidota bacterium]